MDLKKFTTSDWLKVGGGALFFIAGFLAWWTIDIEIASASSNAFDYFFTGIIPWLIFSAIAILTVLAVTGTFTLPRTVPAPLVFVLGSALGLLLVLFRFFSDGVDDDFGIIDRGIGLYLALLAAIVVLVGSVLGFKESGGDLNDLKDFNKIKQSFGGADDAPPPPPPPA